MKEHFAAWSGKCAGTLKNLEKGCKPKEVIFRLSEDLLAHYTGQPLVNPYDVYQQLMDYWAATMQDDCYLLAAEGWKAQPERIIVTTKTGREKDKGWSCDLVPKPLVVARYFAKEQAAIDQLAGELESVSAKLAELEEEHGGDEGFFAELDKVNKANVNARLREIRGDPEARDEAAVLKAWRRLDDEAGELKMRIREAEAELDTLAYEQYAKLSEDEIKELVVEDKWLASLAAAVHGELDRVSQQLAQRVRELAERYEAPLPELSNRVAELEARVNGHLERMGFSWR